MLTSTAEGRGARHGEERNNRLERETAKDDFVMGDGTPVTVTYSGCTLTVAEKWCDHCETWVEVRGVIGALKWLGRHGDGDCVSPEGS